jgi:ribonuclease III
LNNLHILIESLNLTFTDENLLQQAFLHSSYVNENAIPALENNERLEFLGDAILNLIAAEKIFQKFPNLSEGELTEIRVQLVREETLAQVSHELHFGDYLLLGKGEEVSGGRNRKSNLANVFEAFLGALYLDQGIQSVREFIIGQMGNMFDSIRPEEIVKQNYKAKLQEHTQAQFKILPFYKVTASIGPDHDKTFTVEVRLGEEILGSGIGKNKKAAEMSAACTACQKLNLI